MKNSLLALLLLVSGAAGATAFVYQGRLAESGLPAGGAFDMEFQVYDQAVDGVALSTPLLVPAVQVTEGFFSVELDFGDVFGAGPSWLEIRLAVPGAGAPVALSSRQPLTPVPYAITASRVDWLGVQNVPAQLLDGDDDTLGALNCADGQVVVRSAGAWTCGAAPGAAPEVLGVSAASSDGSFSFGNFTGMAAADAMCRATFTSVPNAHLCTAHELDRAVATGAVNPTVNNQSTWSAMSSFGNTASTSSSFSNCFNLVVTASALQALGTRVAIQLNSQAPSGENGDVLNYQKNRSCAETYPVLCCR